MPAPVPPSGFAVNSDPDDETKPQTVFDLDVVGWRFDCLAASGWPIDLAVLLAERGEVDLHQACELLERGAGVHMALRILT